MVRILLMLSHSHFQFPIKASCLAHCIVGSEVDYNITFSRDLYRRGEAGAFNFELVNTTVNTAIKQKVVS